MGLLEVDGGGEVDEDGVGPAGAGRAEEDVVGADVGVDDALAVDVAHGLGELLRDVAQGVGREDAREDALLLSVRAWPSGVES